MSVSQDKRRPFTLRVFFPDGNPNGIRVIDDNNWTGRAICINRDEMDNKQVFEEAEVHNQPGVYVLLGEVDDNAEDAEFSSQIYIGETDDLLKRLKEHASKKDGKDFWHLAIAFYSTKGALSKGHCLWLEDKLIAQAKSVNRCLLENKQGSGAKLTPSERADCEHFFDRMLEILPLAGIQIFEAKEVQVHFVKEDKKAKADDLAPDTIVVPARKEGFDRVFLGEDCWYAIRINRNRLDDLKYIAGYQVGKIGAVTHYGEIKKIEPYGDQGKYKVIFKSKATKLDNPVKYKSGVDSSLQASRYTWFDKLSSAKNLTELFE